MLTLPLVALLWLSPAQQFEPFLAKVQSAVAAGSWTDLRPLLAAPTSAGGLELMAPGAVLRQWKVDSISAPPGLERFGKRWLIFHKYEELEADHDAVHPVVETPGGLRIGNEIPEDLATGYTIGKYDLKVAFSVSTSEVAISADCELKRLDSTMSTAVMRMNDAYVVKSATLQGRTVPISKQPDKTKPTLVQSGGLLYLANAGNGGTLTLNYSLSLNITGLDKTTASQLLLTSYWYPNIGRAPATSRTRVSGPKDWIYFADGNVEGEKVEGETKSVQFKNAVPLCWLHVCGGPYKLAAQVEDRGRKIRSWQMDLNEVRGKQDAESARSAIAFFEDRFGPFPYDHYDVVDTPDFYGVECYSFTVLTPSITSWAASHEVGHSYFGGLVPNSYLKSIWNESITQYVDSIQLKNNKDRSLQFGYATKNQRIALTDAFTPHGPFGNTGYYRGAYVMKMLENEIGLETMNRSLRLLVTERKGKLTEWNDVATTFSKTAGDIGWFFDQWIRGRTFPTIAVARGLSEKVSEGRYNTSVILTQSGTERPYKLKFEIIVETVDGEKRFPARLEASSAEFDLETSTKSRRISIDPMGWTLATVPGPFRLTDGNHLAR